jgi:hypothetical protein
LCGGTILLAELGRERGKNREPELFRSWGGKPSTQLLRHRDNANEVLLSRRHKKLAALIPGQHLPTVAEESENPALADKAYDSCVAFLLEKTRDQKAFSLLFEENCSYGFRRNLWGMKPIGIFISFAAVLAIVSGLAMRVLTPQPLVVICGCLTLLISLIWILVIRPTWIKTVAFSYAERLLAACDVLEPPKPEEGRIRLAE